MRAQQALVVAFAALVLLASCGSNTKQSASATTTTPTAPTYVDKTAQTTVTITARDDFFTPQFVKVRAGTTIVFENTGHNEHNVISGDGSFANVETDAFAPGETAKVELDKPGTHTYYCSLHGAPGAGMYGSMLVVP
jgi:plastocyanin